MSPDTGLNMSISVRVAEGDNRYKGRLRPFITFSSALYLL